MVTYSGFCDFLGAFRVETAMRRLTGLRLEQYAAAFHVDEKILTGEKQNMSVSSAGADKWDRRFAQYEQMFSKGIMKSNYAIDKVLPILEGYYHIRTGRNEMNHANDESVMMSDKIKELIQTTLDEIEGIS